MISTLALFSCFLGATALAAQPADAVRQGGNFGIGLGGSTAVSGVSMKYFLSDAFAVQGVVGAAGYGYYRYDGYDRGRDYRYGRTALGVNVDALWELPALATVDEAFELGLNVGVGGWTWIGSPLWLGANGVLGLEFNIIPVPIDIVLEYQPSLRLVPGVGFEPIAFGGHIRFYFN